MCQISEKESDFTFTRSFTLNEIVIMCLCEFKSFIITMPI